MQLLLMTWIVGLLTTRWKRPGMRRDLLTRLFDWGAGIAGDEPNPGASARGR